MAFCKYSIDMLANNTTSVDNIFINNYLPYAKPEHVAIYLYGLYKCQNADASDNTLERFAAELHITEQAVEEAFSFWQEQGLVQLVSVIPFEVRYLPISDVLTNHKKYNSKKFENFNVQAQEILRGRMITPNEYREYYDIIERLHMEKEALLMIINFCASVKGDNVGYAYITTIAKDWANQKITTAKQVEERLLQLETLKSGAENLAKILGIRRIPSVEERQLYQKWIDEGFDDEVLNFLAKKNKKSFEALDKQLDKYYAQKLLTASEIELYEAEKEASRNLAISICKNLGLYYENLEPVVDTYVFPWLSMGFSQKMLEDVSNYCFKTDVRTLEGMNKSLQKFHKLGILSEQSLTEYFSSVIANDNKIKDILEKIGLSRNVNQFDRDKHKIWTQIWKFSDDVIEYACTLAVGKDQPMQYLAGVLSAFHDKNIRTVDEAKKSYEIVSPKANKANFSTGHTYTKQQMNALFQSIEEIEV